MSKVNSISGLYKTDALTQAVNAISPISISIPIINIDSAELDKQKDFLDGVKVSLIDLFLKPKQINKLANDDNFYSKIIEKNDLLKESLLNIKKIIKMPILNTDIKDKLSIIYYELADVKSLSDNLYKEIYSIRNKKNRNVYSSNIDFNELLDVADKIHSEIDKYRD